MKRSVNITHWARLAVILAVPIVVIPNVLAQQVPSLRDAQEEARRAQYQEKLGQVLNDKAGYAAAIAQRWESEARASAKWDENYPMDLQNALMKLQPDNLLAAGEASTYEAMLHVLATGRPVPASLPAVLGDIADDLVYTPVAPCRIVDTRSAGGPIAAGTTRSFDVDGSNFSAQGGNPGACGILYGVARAVTMNITVTQPNAGGYFTAWAVGSPTPLASILNYATGNTLANTTIVPALPGAGTDFYLYSSATAHAVIDVLGYFAAPVATPLDCITITSAVTACPYNTWTAIDAYCPAGRTATGGGYNTTEGSLGYPGVWLTTIPVANGWRTWVDNQNSNGSRNMQTYANCCRIPGR